MSKRRTTEEFIEECTNIHNGKYDYSLVTYKSKEDKVQIICPIHGVFEQVAKLHLKGSGCPKCSYIYRSNLYRKTKEEFIEEANKIHNNFFYYDKFEYINAHTKSIITCPIHGDFEQNPNDHLMGKGCPHCNMSYLEKEVFSNLQRNNISFSFQKKFEWLGKQSLDFYLPSYNIAIECQGKQHFGVGGWGEQHVLTMQKERDIKKQKLCEKHGIKLIYFTHWKINLGKFYTEENTFFNIDEILYKELRFKKNNWIEEMESYYNSLYEKSYKSQKIKILGVDLIKHSEKTVPNNFLLKQMNFYLQNKETPIHVFEDEWLYKQDIVKSRLKNILGLNDEKIYARKCEIKSVSNEESKKFLEENHIQGNINGIYKLGLYYKGELISYMSFGKLRKNMGNCHKDNTYELLRFCNKINTTVVGGASKLFKYFILTIKPSKVISYCDLRWSKGELYGILGFKLSHISRPNYFYINEISKKRENRFKYRKDVLIKNGYNQEKSEHKIMLEKGFFRIFDCGCKVFVYD